MENQIVALEKKYWEGMETHNYETVRSLTHFPCIVAGRDGVRSVDEASFKKMFESGENKKMKVHDISGFEVQVLNDKTTAITGYIIALEYPADDRSGIAKCACSSTWIKNGDRWVCVLHSETELKK